MVSDKKKFTGLLQKLYTLKALVNTTEEKKIELAG